MNKTWFTSDTHFGHNNIIKYCNRPFTNASHMNEVIINNWNSVVNDGDTVYHLGDFALCHINNAFDILKRLKGEIHFIQGNHDKVAGLMANDFKSYNRGFIEVSVNNQKIVLCHYSMRVWNGSHKGVWHLYGHSHGTLPDDPNSLSFDCGVDCHNMFPLSFNDVERIMNKKTFKPIDHHGKE